MILCKCWLVFSCPYPTEIFWHSIRASKSTDKLVLCTSETWINRFWRLEIVNVFAGYCCSRSRCSSYCATRLDFQTIFYLKMYVTKVVTKQRFEIVSAPKNFGSRFRNPVGLSVVAILMKRELGCLTKVSLEERSRRPSSLNRSNLYEREKNFLRRGGVVKFIYGYRLSRH